jgi:protein disulfide-isomerase A1
MSINVQKHLNSQPTPADWDAQAVKVLTGENFAAVALNADKHALVEFC